MTLLWNHKASQNPEVIKSSVLAVDRAFIKDIIANDELARLIIAMAKSLGLSIVAEGVETQEQLDFLKENDLDEFQGYFVSPPVPANEFEELLYNYNAVRA